MSPLDSHAEAGTLWKEMLDSVFSILDTVERTVEQEQYSSSLKKVLVESMHLALDLKQAYIVGRCGHLSNSLAGAESTRPPRAA